MKNLGVVEGEKKKAFSHRRETPFSLPEKNLEGLRGRSAYFDNNGKMRVARGQNGRALPRG